ncbi:hypothetical protein DOTSEDRAFT_54646 [Dothistroma septosporum NZE10]|uniref:Uncharacterized protein n=1 Tax=Dothistroma septosporum (strain NZE10 / CBS 128990) TaxID=675120 RepID=N1PJE4_DOTSN|nr:hypothetical protein DOTSEDRAFT_54646 [Dothistroma septosporum NZE10]
MYLFRFLTILLLPILAPASPLVVSYPIPQNDFTCRSTTHQNPVVFFHGLGATYYEDLNYLQSHLQSQGFCTFSTTYGAYPAFPYIGGLKPIASSALELAAFIAEVQSKAGAIKIDLVCSSRIRPFPGHRTMTYKLTDPILPQVGHSEGAFLTLYVPKFTNTSSLIDKIIAIAPPTHGTDFDNLYDLAYLFGNASRETVGDVLNTVGCAACDELGPGGTAVTALTTGPIVQSGSSVTILASRYDQLVTPTGTSFVDEAGVRNLYIQQFCPSDFVGHIGEAYDPNVWDIVRKTLNGLDMDEVGPDVISMADTSPADPSVHKNDLDGLRSQIIANASVLFSTVHKKELGPGTAYAAGNDFEVLMDMDEVGTAGDSSRQEVRASVVFRRPGERSEQKKYRQAAPSLAFDTIHGALNSLLHALARALSPFKHY